MQKNMSREFTLILFFAVAKLALHLFTNTNYDLHRDEYLYIAMKDHLDFGFMTVPPFVAVIAKMSWFLFGHTVFGYRFFASLAGSLTVVLIGLSIIELGGKRWAIMISSISYILSGLYLHINFLLQPVTFDVFFWTLSFYLLLRLINRGDLRTWILLGIVAGIGLQNKYSIVLLVAGVIFSLLLAGKWKLLFNKYFFTACLVAILVILPNLIWQYRHNFPVIHHMTELRERHLVHVGMTNFLVDQFVMSMFSSLVWLFALVDMLFFKDERKYRSLGFTFLVVIMMLILAKGKNYYTAGLYPFMFAFGGYAIEKYTSRNSLVGSRSRYLAAGIRYLLLVLLLLPIPFLPYAMPILKPESMDAYCRKTAKYVNYAPVRWEDGEIHALPQDWADMIGWKELGDIVIAAYKNLPPDERSSCTIYAENYGQASAIAYYGKPAGLPEPVSFHESYIFWAPDSIRKGYFIYVNDDPSEIKTHFDSVIQVGHINKTYARENGLPVFLCMKPNADFPIFYASKVKSLKDRYR